MTVILLASFVLLWGAVLWLVFVVTGLAKLVGNIYDSGVVPHARPTSFTLPSDLEISEDLVLRYVDGRDVRAADLPTKLCAVLSVSPGCSSCASLMPGVRALARSLRGEVTIALMLIGQGDVSVLERYRADHRLFSLPIVSEDGFAGSIGISLAPHVLLLRIDDTVSVAESALVGTIDQLSGLLERALAAERSVEAEESATDDAPSIATI